MFQISGTIGDCVMATAVCEAIKKKYFDAELIVISNFIEVFYNNPFVDRVFRFNELIYFYETYIENEEIKVFANNPNFQSETILKTDNLIKIWCDMVGVDYNNERPQIYLTNRETSFYGKNFGSKNPILVLQTNGGNTGDSRYSWARDLPVHVVKSVIEEFRDVYDICHIRRNDQIKYENTIPIENNLRDVFGLLQWSTKRLFIDSFAQHAASALNLPSTVCWITTDPKVYGYGIHDNIISNPFTQKSNIIKSYLTKYDIDGESSEFPYGDEKEIFDVDAIIKSIKRQ